MSLLYIQGYPFQKLWKTLMSVWVNIDQDIPEQQVVYYIVKGPYSIMHGMEQ